MKYPILPALLLVLATTQAYAAGMPEALTAFPNRPAAPGFVLQDLNGKTHRLSDYRGKVVVVNFWATWCPPCRHEMPSMERAWKKLKNKGVAIVAIDVGQNADTVFTFLADFPVTFPLLLDRDSSVVQKWSVRGLPTTFIVDPKGRLAYRAIGGRDWTDAALMQKILELRPPHPVTNVKAH